MIRDSKGAQPLWPPEAFITTPAAACFDTALVRRVALSRSGPGHGLWRLDIANPGVTAFAPGQFMMLRPQSFALDPLWGRPFSIYSLNPGTISFFIQVAGRGTAALAGLEPGAPLTVWGPLGNAFAVEPDARTLILAGGVGLAPFPAYARRHPEPSRLSLVFGHRPPLSAYPFKEVAAVANAEHFRECGPGDIETFIALLDERIGGFRDGLILACGPQPFLLTVKRLARAHKAKLQISLENRMACGVGACLGCVTKMAVAGASPEVAFANVQVCTKGPVFWADQVRLEGEEPWT
jgi:dihydroorotate dehydrogenase electron transfer subunit